MTDELDRRLVNRMGALAARLSDAVAAATAEHRRAAASHPEALTALLNFAEDERAESLQTVLGLSQPGVAHLIAKLEARGLVRRRPDPDDARASRVHLTEEGRDVAKRMLEAREAAIADVLGRLSRTHQASLLRVVDTILEHDTTSVSRARQTCRGCDASACKHPSTCPVTIGADRCRLSSP